MSRRFGAYSTMLESSSLVDTRSAHARRRLYLKCWRYKYQQSSRIISGKLNYFVKRKVIIDTVIGTMLKTKCMSTVIVFHMILSLMVMTSSADMKSLIATFSPPCRNILEYSSTSPTEMCTQTNLVRLFIAMVNVGFCTEAEINSLTQQECGKTVRPTTDVSEARKNLYAALNKISSNCHIRAAKCISSKVVRSVLKIQEQFCSLMNLDVGGESSQRCMTSAGQDMTSVQANCTLDEFNQMKTAACTVTSTRVDQTFSKAVLVTTSTCQNQISTCAKPRQDLVLNEKYCDFMNFKDSTGSTEACLKTGNVCKSEEFDKLKVAACSLATSAKLSFVSISMTFIFALFIQL
ncbi:hypothetical protein Btru_064672 [Bulinus truncatus]|nr:hypothetical protein Btru_064672 [Bulinus truncatus]